jgi:hypothetical protein
MTGDGGDGCGGGAGNSMEAIVLASRLTTTFGGVRGRGVTGGDGLPLGDGVPIL